MLSLTRTVTFPATHALRDQRLSDAENQARFGGTASEHGHQYAVSVTVSGDPDAETGALLDLTQLDRLLADRIVGPLAGRSLNETVPVFAKEGRLATCEALAAYLFRRLAPALPEGLRLERVRVAEDASLHADCTGTS